MDTPTETAGAATVPAEATASAGAAVTEAEILRALRVVRDPDLGAVAAGALAALGGVRTRGVVVIAATGERQRRHQSHGCNLAEPAQDASLEK